MENEIKQLPKNNTISICLKCLKEKKMYCKGICKSCYNLIHLSPEKKKEGYRRWKEKHPDYFINYYNKHKKVKDETKQI